MAHMIDQTNGVDAIAYKGQTPWHGLGFAMQENEPLETWRTRAGLGWEAVKTPVLFQGAQDIGTMTGKSVLFRSDTQAALSVVSDRYNIVQPETCVEFFRDLIERHGYNMETLGAIKEGRVVWALANTGDQMRISGNDLVKGYLLLSTSFDGSMATTGRFTTVRVVCNNTLSAAFKAGKAAVSIPHSTMFDMDAAKVKLGTGDAFVRFQDEAQQMAETGVTKKQAIEFFLEVYHDMTAAAIVDKQTQATTDRTMARLAELFVAGPGADLRSAKGTAWGLLNAVTHDVDFSARRRTADARLTSAWFGPGADLKEKARTLALAMAA